MDEISNFDPTISSSNLTRAVEICIKYIHKGPGIQIVLWVFCFCFFSFFTLISFSHYILQAQRLSVAPHRQTMHGNQQSLLASFFRAVEETSCDRHSDPKMENLSPDLVFPELRTSPAAPRKALVMQFDSS